MKFIKYELVDSVGVVTFNRPPVNALNIQAYDEIRDIFNTISQDRSVRSVILKAEGKAFMAGNDVNDLASMSSEGFARYEKHIQESTQSVYECRVPVIAAINGATVGGGLFYAANCDVIIATEKAKFSIPEINVGIVGAGEALSRMLPHKLVRYYSLTGEFISAAKIKELGGLLEVVSEDKLMDRAFDVATKIAKQSPLAVEHWKQYLNKIDLINKVEGDSVLRTRLLYQHEDAKEAAMAFLEKREPIFKGSTE